MTNPAPDSIAPSLAFLEQLAHEAVSTLPDPFREPATHIRLRVEEFPADEMLEELGIDDAGDVWSGGRAVAVVTGHLDWAA